MASVHQHTQGVYVSSDEARAALVSGTRIEIEETGRNVALSSFIYSKTNFWINESREYVGDHKLTRYLYVVFMDWVFPLAFIISLFSPTNFILTCVMLGIGVVFLLVFIQHMYVNVKTMRYVLKQPRVPNGWLQHQNTFFEITIDKYEAFFAASSQAGIGQIVAGTGKVKIQVFQNRAFATMKACCILSTVYFLMAIILVLYCLGWGIVWAVSFLT